MAHIPLISTGGIGGLALAEHGGMGPGGGMTGSGMGLGGGMHGSGMGQGGGMHGGGMGVGGGGLYVVAPISGRKKRAAEEFVKNITRSRQISRTI